MRGTASESYYTVVHKDSTQHSKGLALESRSATLLYSMPLFVGWGWHDDRCATALLKL